MTSLQRNLNFAIEREGVRYLAIGGYCMRCLGFDRTTSDLDLWIDRSPENAARMERVIEQLAPGHAPEGRTWFDVFQLDACLVEYPSMGPGKEVYILTSLAEMSFDECYARSSISNVDGISLRVLSVNDLLQSKLLALRLGTDIPGQVRDQADHDQLCARLRMSHSSEQWG